jgi:hypothetical protein
MIIIGCFIENGKEWLIYTLPNSKYLILAFGKLPSIGNELFAILNKRSGHKCLF